jgi:hypothetical protein
MLPLPSLPPLATLASFSHTPQTHVAVVLLHGPLDEVVVAYEHRCVNSPLWPAGNMKGVGAAPRQQLKALPLFSKGLKPLNGWNGTAADTRRMQARKSEQTDMPVHICKACSLQQMLQLLSTLYPLAHTYTPSVLPKSVMK